MNPVTIITSAVTGIGGLAEQLGDIAPIGLAVGVSIFALTKGWGLLRRFVN